MKHPEYDSPFVLNLSDITAQMAQNIDEMCLKAVQRVGINVDEEKLLTALNQDSERYRSAYKNGYATGYETRDEEIIRCRDCIHYRYYGLSEETVSECRIGHAENHDGNWYCADGERRKEQ